MIESIKKIDNPLLKSITYASMGFAITTIVSGAVRSDISRLYKGFGFVDENWTIQNLVFVACP